MIKFLITITSLLTLPISVLPLLNQESKSELKEEVNSQKEWNFQNFTIRKNVDANEGLYFAINNINLSQIGIANINELNSYSTISIPNLKITYDDKVVVSGDSWKTNRKLGSEDWYQMFKKQSGNTTMYLESASTIWYSDSGDLMMRLAYSASMVTYIPPRIVIGGTISFESGSVVKIY